MGDKQNQDDVRKQLQLEKEFVEQTAYLVRMSNQSMLRRIVDYRNNLFDGNTTNMYNLANAVRNRVVATYRNDNETHSCLVRNCPPPMGGSTCGCFTTSSGYGCMDGTWYFVSPALKSYISFNNGNVVNTNASNTTSCKFTGNYYGTSTCEAGAAAQLQVMWYFGYDWGYDTNNGTWFYDTRTNSKYRVNAFINGGYVLTGSEKPPSNFTYIPTYENYGAHAEVCFFQPDIVGYQNPSYGEGGMVTVPWTKLDYTGCSAGTWPKAPYNSTNATNCYIYFASPAEAGYETGCAQTDSECSTEYWWYGTLPAPYNNGCKKTDSECLSYWWYGYLPQPFSM